MVATTFTLLSSDVTLRIMFFPSSHTS